MTSLFGTEEEWSRKQNAKVENLAAPNVCTPRSFDRMMFLDIYSYAPHATTYVGSGFPFAFPPILSFLVIWLVPGLRVGHQRHDHSLFHTCTRDPGGGSLLVLGNVLAGKEVSYSVQRDVRSYPLKEENPAASING